MFTGRFDQPPVEVLFDRICRENGIEHLLTAPRSPTTTGKIERFHRSLRTEFDTTQVFASITMAQQALDSARPAGESARRVLVLFAFEDGPTEACTRARCVVA